MLAVRITDVAARGSKLLGGVRRGVLARVRTWHLLSAGTSGIVVLNIVRAIRRGYVPLGDASFIEARARDVFSSHPPLVNMLSTVSERADVHHPGPLLFDLLAIPVRIGPHGVGLALGAGMINIAAIWAIGHCARRFLGDPGAAIVMAGTAALVWSFGGLLWVDPWQPYIAMLPFLLLLVSAWGFATGARGLGVWMVLAGSFVVQTHGSYLLIGPVVVAAAIGLRLARRGRPPVDWRGAAALAGFGVALWLQPLIQQLFGAGPGNLSQLAATANSDYQLVLGIDDAVRTIAAVVAAPPLFTRPGVDSSLPELGGWILSDPPVFELDTIGLLAASIALAGVAAGVTALTLLATMRRDRKVVRGSLVVLAAVASSAIFVARLPVDELGFMVHKVRFLWPLGAFVVIVVLVAVASVLPRWRSYVSLAAAVAGAAAVVVNIPSHVPRSVGANLAHVFEDPAVELRTAMSALEDQGTVYVPFEEAVGAAFANAMIPELIARDIPVVVSHPWGVGQYGSHRGFDGVADVTLRVDVRAVGDRPPAAGEVVGAARFVLPPQVFGQDLIDRYGDDEVVARVVVTPFQSDDVPSDERAG